MIDMIGTLFFTIYLCSQLKILFHIGFAVEIVQGQKLQIILNLLTEDRNIDIVNFHVIRWMA